jgi:putative transposase
MTMKEKQLAPVDFNNLDAELKKIKTQADFFGPEGLMKRMIKTSLEALLSAEMEDHLGYAKHSISGRNTGNSRNGTTKKTVRSATGEIEVVSPRDRNSTFEPQVVQKHQKTLGLLDHHIISMYAKGMTTRDISSHLAAIYGVDVSPAFITTATEKVMAAAHEWQLRPLSAVYPIVFFDAIHYNVREGGKVINKAVYICLGIDLDGKKDVLGIWIGENEGAHFWLAIFSELKNRGVTDIFIACMDGLKGLPDALKSVYPKTLVQLCIVHMIRNSLKYVGSKNKEQFIKDLKEVYEASSLEAAEKALDELIKQWGKLYPHAVNSWVHNWDNVTTYFSFPPELRKVMYTTNAIESLNRQIRKVTKNRSILSNNDALFKLLYLAVQDIQKKWNHSIRDWGTINSQLAVLFGDRMGLQKIADKGIL